MSKYVRIIEEEIETVKGWILRYQRTGAYHTNCEVWSHHITAYEKILELISAEVKRSKRTAVQRS